MFQVLPVAFAVALFVLPSAHAQQTDSVARSLSQHGITWHFDRAVSTGTYVNGDYWVVGPVGVIALAPAPVAGAGGSMRNGSMRNPRAGDTGRSQGQGYDSRIGFYRQSASAQLPIALQAGDTLISTISRVGNIKQQQVFRRILSHGVLRTAAVLTCVATPPPTDAFRPAYCGPKREFLARNLRWSQLPRLPKTPTQLTPQSYVRQFQRVWLDHLLGWESRLMHPYENMSDYGREIALSVGEGGLLLLEDYSFAEIAELMVHYVQVGIDLHGLVADGHRWWGDGGHLIGRKWPILFAGFMLDDPAMLHPGTGFSEDAQTYFASGWSGTRALFRMRGADTHEQTPPHTWTATEISYERYRRCCTSIAWVGEALAAMALNLTENWDHPEFFEYTERWMTKMLPADRLATRNIVGQTVDWFPHGFVDSPYIRAMWRRWRPSFQPTGVRQIGQSSVTDLRLAIFEPARADRPIEIQVYNTPRTDGYLLVGPIAPPTPLLGATLWVGGTPALYPVRANAHGRTVTQVIPPPILSGTSAPPFAAQLLWFDPSSGTASNSWAYELQLR